MKFKFSKILGIGLMSTLLTGCFGAIETGQVGVRTSMSGQVESEEIGQGWYQHFFSTVRKFSVKQIPIQLDDLKPKAGDNLRLQDFDVTVYYTVNSNAVSDIYIKYQNSTVKDEESGIFYPAFTLVKNLARSATNDAVSKIPSMQINEKRVELEASIKQSLQQDLDEADKGVFTIDRVNITNILTDEVVEKSIRNIAESENKRKTAENNLAVARIQAEEFRVRSQALDEKILAEKQLEVLLKLAESNNRVFVVPQDFKGILNVGN